MDCIGEKNYKAGAVQKSTTEAESTLSRRWRKDRSGFYYVAEVIKKAPIFPKAYRTGKAGWINPIKNVGCHIYLEKPPWEYLWKFTAIRLF